MSTDLLWQQQHPPQNSAPHHGQGGGEEREREHEISDSYPQLTQNGSHQVQEWDPSAFLNPSMLNPDIANGGQSPNHFQLGSKPVPQMAGQQNMVQNAHTVSNPYPFGQDSFSDSFAPDTFAPPFDMYPQSQATRQSFDASGFHPSSQSTSELSPSMASLGLHQDMMYPSSGPYQQHNPHLQTLSGHYDFHPSSEVAPNGRASPHPRASPYVISPASNHSFATQQDYSGVLERRPSTADEPHSLPGEYPTDFAMLPTTAVDPGRRIINNGPTILGAGIPPSSLHPFNGRNNGTPFPQHLSPDGQPITRSYIPVAAPQTGVPQQGPFISQHPFPSHQSQYGSDPNYHHLPPNALDPEPSVYSPLNAGSSDVAHFIRPALQQYMETPNRIAFGERTVIVMASKVAQKSYGQERRFLCPPPAAIMIGNSWWTESAIGRDDRRPPRVTISISGESIPPESVVEWTSTSGKPVVLGEAPPEPSFAHEDISAFAQPGTTTAQTYIGRAVGKQLFISDERQKKVEALVKIVAPGPEDEPERVIGTFPSRPIKVISKPSKKRQSAKNMELCINHGSTVSLFHRLRAQTVSTKYLCVSGSGQSFKGSDGAPLPGVDAHQLNTPSFVAKIGTWDPFIIYIVDPTKPPGGPDTMSPPPLQPDYPIPPHNAINMMHHGSHIPIYYNQTVVLQCLTSGVVSPILIIRKAENTTVVGGGLQEGAKGVPDHFCAPGEVCGDPVSQLHKVAFEVFDASKGAPPPGSTGTTGAFLSCMGDKVNTYRPPDSRTWNNSEMSSRSQSPAVPDSPGGSSTGSLTDYFSSGSPVDSNLDKLVPSSDGGRVARRSAKRSNTTANGPVFKGQSKARRRVNSVGSNGSAGDAPISSSTRFGLSDQAMSSGALWSLDIGESAVWTIVGTEQIRYSFYIPPVVPGARASGVPLKPVTPFPSIVKYLPPDRAAENPMKHGGINRMLVNNGMKADPRNGSLVTIYGENFSKNEPPLLFFGTEPSPFVDVRCQEVLACLPPPTASPGGAMEPQVKMEGGGTAPTPLFIARPDGVIYPSNVLFYGK